MVDPWRPFSDKCPDHVVWLHTAFLGDLVILSSAIQLLREFSPRTKQHLVTTPVGVELFKMGTELDFLHIFDKSGGSFVKSLGKIKRSVFGPILSNENAVVIQPHKSLRSTLLATYLGLPRVTYYETVWSFSATCRVPRVSVFHENQRLNLLLEPLGLDRKACLAGKMKLQPLANPARLSLGEEWGEFKEKFPRVVAIAPGSRWGTKKWPIERFVELANRMSKIGLGLVVLGSKNEYAEAEKICSVAQDAILNLCGKTSLSDLRYLYPQLDAVITNDSSPVHFASAFNIATIAIFGATVPAFGFGPKADNSHVVEVVDLPCRPCSDHGPEICPLGHFKCMQEIEVEAVFSALKKVQGALG